MPELLVRPHGSLFPHLLGGIPNTATFTIGEYSDPIAALATGRAQAQFNFGPALYHLPIGDFSSSLNITQDAYGTGDMKAQVEQMDTLTSPIGNHFQNILSYSNQHVNGLGNEPFTFDTIGGAYKNLQEVLKVYNGSVYAFSLQTGTAFNMQAQPVAYQLLMRPSPLSSLSLTGNFTPGPGFGFDRTNVQIITPIGKTPISNSRPTWIGRTTCGSKARTSTARSDRRLLRDPHLVQRRPQGCRGHARHPRVPSQGLNFGLGSGNSTVVPQSFATSQFFGQ